MLTNIIFSLLGLGIAVGILFIYWFVKLIKLVVELEQTHEEP
jgi:hypothetical protein